MEELTVEEKMFILNAISYYREGILRPILDKYEKSPNNDKVKVNIKNYMIEQFDLSLKITDKIFF